MKYVWTTIQVSDLEESIWFYGEVLGLKMTSRQPAGPGREIAFFASEDTTTKIELIGEKDGQGVTAEGISLGFQCTDIETMHKEMRETGFDPSEIIQPNDHVCFFFIKDPDNVTIQFVQEM